MSLQRDETLKSKVFRAIAEDPDKFAFGNYQELADRFSVGYGSIRNLACDWRKENVQPTDTHEGLEAECQKVGIPLNSVGHYWYKGKHYSIHAKANGLSYLQAIEDIVRDLPTRKLPPLVTTKKKSLVALNATLSDMHVGMEPNPEGKALFQYRYDAEIFNDHLNQVYEAILKEHARYGTFDVLVIDDLGDGLDGWDGFTTRGGHALPQNMDNVTAFKTYVFGKLDLVERVYKAKVAKKIYVRNVTQCNHSGNFGHTANIAIQMMIERMYAKSAIEYVILERFMEHFEYGDHTFILTHGKDPKHMKRGLPFKLTPDAENFILDYIEHYGISTKYIHLCKGDLHQVGYERTKKFDYRNFMSFAPPSAYGQHNYGDGYGGFSIQVIPKHSNAIAHTDYFFEFKKSVEKSK
jgi:hypothetical protein